jgi:hypothetical protein
VNADASPEFKPPQIYRDLTGVIDDEKQKALGLAAKMHQTFRVEWELPPNKLSCEQAVDDILAGGDGFGGRRHRFVVEDASNEPGKPLREVLSRDDFSSWDASKAAYLVN